MTMRSGLIGLAVALCASVLPGYGLAQAPASTPSATPSAAPSSTPSAAPAANPTGDSQAKRQAEQPGNNAPVWREVRKEGVEHFTTIQGRETGVLVQSAGETWRRIRNGPITFYGGWLIVLVLAAIAAFYLWKGPIKLHEPPSGRMILRFKAIERWSHWCVAISFSVLGISGLVILFGKHVLLPVIGYTLFAWLTLLMKNLHNFIGPLFIVSIVLMAVVYARYNLPIKEDLDWLAKAGGLVSGKHVPSGRFNAGEKGWFWLGVVVLGIIMTVSGLVLLFPNFDQVRSTMQTANIVHGIGGVVFIAISFGHIYLGTIGMQGAYEGMRTGYVDEEWAKEHHELWYKDVKAGKTDGGSEPAPAAPQPQH